MADNSQRQDPENLQNPESYRGGQPSQVGRANPPDDRYDTYDPSTVVVDRSREQGDGFGQKDLDYQRDPAMGLNPEEYSFAPNEDGVVEHAEGGQSGLESQAGPPGKPDRDYDERDRDEVSVDFPGA